MMMMRDDVGVDTFKVESFVPSRVERASFDLCFESVLLVG